MATCLRATGLRPVGEGLSATGLLAAAAAAAQQKEPELQPELAFNHTTLCIVSLPRSPYAGKEYKRQHRSHWVKVRAGSLDLGAGPEKRVIPHGALARLALIWLTTRAVKTRRREIEIPRTPRAWLKELGGAVDSRRAARLDWTFLDLLGAEWIFGRSRVTEFRRLAAKVEISARKNWPLQVTLSGDYYADLISGQAAVPLDAAALRALAGSALALDLYAWLTLRRYRLEEEVMVPWAALYRQHGQEFEGLRPSDDFRGSARQALGLIAAVVPGWLRLGASEGVVILPPRGGP